MEVPFVMGRQGNEAAASEMYTLYQSGLSLAEVAALRGISRQTVYEVFRRRGLALRSRTLHPTITYRDDTFATDPDGYYRRTHGDRRFLHQIIWEDNHGPIPPGYEIHHTDETKTNNDPANLECLTPSEHARRHHFPQATPDRHCLACGRLLVRRREPSGHIEPPCRIAKRFFCNTSCHADARRGKPAGWRVARG